MARMRNKPNCAKCSNYDKRIDFCVIPMQLIKRELFDFRQLCDLAIEIIQEWLRENE